MKRMMIVLLGTLLTFMSVSCNMEKDASNDEASLDSGSLLEVGDVNDQGSASEFGGVALDETLPYEYILNPEFDRERGIEIPPYFAATEFDTAFDFEEWSDIEYPLSGAWSVNKFEEKYGKADEVHGCLYANTGVDVYLRYEGKRITLRFDERSSLLSFDNDSTHQRVDYPLSKQDKSVSIPLDSIWISGEEMALPRGLKIGESSSEDVKAAYFDASTAIVGVHTDSLSYTYVDFTEIALQAETVDKTQLGSVRYYFDYMQDPDVLILAVLHF